MIAETDNFSFLQKSIGTNLSKIIRSKPNSNPTCIFLWHIYILNMSSIYATVVGIMIGILFKV